MLRLLCDLGCVLAIVNIMLASAKPQPKLQPTWLPRQGALNLPAIICGRTRERDLRKSILFKLIQQGSIRRLDCTCFFIFTDNPRRSVFIAFYKQYDPLGTKLRRWKKVPWGTTSGHPGASFHFSGPFQILGAGARVLWLAVRHTCLYYSHLVMLLH